MLDLYHACVKLTAMLVGLMLLLVEMSHVSPQTAWYRKKADVSDLPWAMRVLSGVFLTTSQGTFLKTDGQPPTHNDSAHVHVCTFTKHACTHTHNLKQIFPETLNHRRRLQKARVATDVLVLFLEKQRGGERGTKSTGWEREKRARMTKRLNTVTVKEKGHSKRTRHKLKG